MCRWHMQTHKHKNTAVHMSENTFNVQFKPESKDVRFLKIIIIIIINFSYFIIILLSNKIESKQFQSN